MKNDAPHEPGQGSMPPPLRLDKPDTHPWDDTVDLVVVGLGGAGVAAALEAAEAGLSVTAVDRYDGGGSSAANGGVYYAGGGTRIQREAGEDDTPEQMYRYLKLEVGDVVADETLRRFCDESTATFDWLVNHGAKFNSRVWKKKTSYPPLDYFLYHSDSSLAAPYAKHAQPAARGHRSHLRNGNKAWELGRGIFDPLRDAAFAAGMGFDRYAEARRLAVDAEGRVIGVQLLQLPAGSQDAKRFGRCIAKATKWLAILPPSFPLARFTGAIGQWYLRRATHIETHRRQARWLRARRGVVLSAGGFVMNREMMAQFAPKYVRGMPLGTLGDTGTGIELGRSVGGALGRMERASAWRFINPPMAWAKAPLVNQQGERFVNETLYGASLGDAIVERQNGKAWIILDARLRREAFAQAKSKDIVPFQRDVTFINLLFNARKASTLEALAARMGFNATTLAETVAQYNKIAAGAATDPFEKRSEECTAIEQGPFYAIDASIDSRLLPMPTMTVGGLRVDETTGEVVDESGRAIAGLYAAGRNAVGVCSNIYVSGLSYADCIFSGRRAAQHAIQTRNASAQAASTPAPN